MSMLPSHLEKILHVNQNAETAVSGEIVCECGCERFGVRYFGEVYKAGRIALKEYNEKYGLTIRAVCRECGKEWELFDFAKHGYDGFINEDGVSVPENELIDAVADDERDFKITMEIELFGEEQFAEEFIDNPPEGMSFTSDDRADIWSWVVIDLKCAKNGKVLKDFVNEELA